MKRRFMSYSFLVAVMIAIFLLFTNTGQAYTIPNSNFTVGSDGLERWTLHNGTASVIHYGGGVNSVRLSGAPSYFSLESSFFDVEAGETISGWFESLTKDKYVQVTIYKQVSTGIEWKNWFFTNTWNTWEKWNFTATESGSYTIYLQNGNASAGEFAFAPVPIPPSVWLLGSGLIGLVGLRRKFFRK